MEASFPSTPPLSQIVRDAEPSLVCIRTPTGSGSGFVVDTDGHVITNAHVVKQHSDVVLEFVNGETHTGTIVGVHPRLDLACVRLPSELMATPLPLGDSTSAQVGEDVVAIGYPLNDILKGSPTVTRGIISAKRLDGLQTDAAINPGNSGGPLLDSQGKAIGVNTSVLAPVAGQAVGGIGFAIPIDDVKEALESLSSGIQIARPAGLPSESVHQGGKTVHHIGNGGFSITLPSEWTSHQPNQQSTWFLNEDSYFSLDLRRVDAEFSLQAFADGMYEWWYKDVSTWTEGDVTWHGKAQTTDRQQYSLSLRGDRGDGSGLLAGQVAWSLCDSPTGSTHLITAELHVLLERDHMTRKRSRDSRETRRLSRRLDTLLKSVSLWDTYWSDLYHWCISAAPGWHSTHYDDMGLILEALDQGAYLTVDIVDVDDSVSAEELCRQSVADQIDREDAWDRYDILSSHEDDFEGHNWYRINFRYQPLGYQPAVICITQVGRSGSLEYVVTARTSELQISDHAVAIDHMLDSFRF
ncbi:MAG: trypsin-like peptidase domain-containing protein [Chloroflexota bacterium]|nr:trypsin-like peptidase domain-containing protein [Chloroflexota bacterium]